MTQDKQLTFAEFTQLALRTESRVSEANINKRSVEKLLEMFITIGTLLDYTKKGIFYNNYTKYDENYNELVEKLNCQFLEFTNSGVEPRRPTSDVNWRVVHGLLGAVTESSEMAEHLLNYLKTGQVDVAGVGEEFSDSDWYKAIVFDELGLSENTCRTNVINKLRVRFPDKYSDEAAANRNLQEERKKLEENL